MNTPTGRAPRGGDGPGQRNRVEEFVAVANAVIGGVGGVYTATESVMAAALALGGVVLLWVTLLGRRDHDR